MQHTTNYNLNKPEGSDLFAPLTDTNPNWDAIDTGMQANKAAAVFTATEVISAGVHAITRAVAGAAMFRFTAVGNYASGDSFTVDGVSVTAVSSKGETLTAGAWVTGAEVLACLKGTVLTLYVSAASTDAQTLEGHAASYFGTAAAVTQAQGDATAAGNVANAASVTANQALAIAQAAGMTMTKVWENNNPSSVFPAQTVSMTNVPTAAKFFIIIYRYTGASDLCKPALAFDGYKNSALCSNAESSGAFTYRNATINKSNSTAVLTNGCLGDGGGQGAGYCIPVAIFAVA